MFTEYTVLKISKAGMKSFLAFYGVCSEAASPVSLNKMKVLPACPQ